MAASIGRPIHQVIVSIVALCLLAVGCAPSGEPTDGAGRGAGYPRTVTDHFGTRTEITSADRVVAAYGSVSDAIFGLGEGDRVAGREKLSAVWPPGEIEKIPDVGEYGGLNVEGIAALGTDLLIIADRFAGMEGNRTLVDQLRAAGIAVLVLPEERRATAEGGYTVEQIEDSVRLIADALAVPEQADRVITEMRREVATARDAASRHCEKFRVLNVRSFGPGRLYTTGDGGVGELFVTLTGGVDVAAEAGLKDYVQLEPEAIGRLHRTSFSGSTSIGGTARTGWPTTGGCPEWARPRPPSAGG